MKTKLSINNNKKIKHLNQIMRTRWNNIKLMIKLKLNQFRIKQPIQLKELNTYLQLINVFLKIKLEKNLMIKINKSQIFNLRSIRLIFSIKKN